MKLKLIVIFLVTFSVVSCIDKRVDSKKEKQIQQLDSLFNYSYSNSLFNGAVLVTKNDTVIYKESFGLENKQTKKAINENSIFYLASVSKQFTAMAIMILEEKGKLSFESTVEDFFPEFIYLMFRRELHHNV